MSIRKSPNEKQLFEVGWCAEKKGLSLDNRKIIKQRECRFFPKIGIPHSL